MLARGVTAAAEVAEAEAGLHAATTRRAVAEIEAKAAREDMQELAMQMHARRLLPIKEILAVTGIKESWFYQLVKLRNNRKAS